MIRFLADVSLNYVIVRGCRRLPQSRIVFLSRTISKTMPAHFADFLLVRGSSPGVLLVPQYLPTAEAIEEIVLIWGASNQEEWRNPILSIPLQ